MSIWLWATFISSVLALLALDLLVVNRRAHVVSTRAALSWTAFTVFLALVFCASVWFIYEHNILGMGVSPEGRDLFTGRRAAEDFLQGWLLEYSLSVDNLFVFAVVFAHFRVPLKNQHRVLFWGILGALVLRGIMIGVGAALVQTFSWVLYIFGGFLLITAWKMLASSESDFDPARSWVVRAARRIFPVSEHYEGQKFFTHLPGGRRAITPLFLVLLVVESTDVVFAVDSIPAIFSVTQDPFIVFTSNVFAILGLRSLYFALAGLMDNFHYLRISLSVILAFVGFKMLTQSWLATRGIHISGTVSLAVIVGSLAAGMVASLIWARKHPGAHELPPPTPPAGEP